MWIEGPSRRAGRARASSSTTATPEAPSFAPTKPGMPSLVSWWAPITIAPGSRPGIAPTTLRCGRCTRTPFTPASRRRAASVPVSRRFAAEPAGRGPILTWASRSANALRSSKREARSAAAGSAGAGGSSFSPQPSAASATTGTSASTASDFPRIDNPRGRVSSMAQGHLDRLTSLDASFLTQEGSASHMHVGAVMIFEGPPPSYEDLLSQIRSRLHLVPRFRQKLAFPPIQLGRPFWVDDPSFNLEYHVRHSALPKPGSEDQLRRMASRIFSQQLDRTKPLWELWLVQGLKRKRFALGTKNPP